MDQWYSPTPPRYVAWMKSKTMNPWDLEQKSFQEPFGGLPWPPRSYACSFCRREFRSAQALGGHMNVHRRDRARLKQASVPAQAAETENLFKCYSSPVHELRADYSSKQALPQKELGNVLLLGSNECTDDAIGTKLTVGMHLNSPGHDYGGSICKKHKKNGPLFCSKPCLDDRHTTSLKEGVDLELRLGNPPALKLEFHQEKFVTIL